MGRTCSCRAGVSASRVSSKDHPPPHAAAPLSGCASGPTAHLKAAPSPVPDTTAADEDSGPYSIISMSITELSTTPRQLLDPARGVTKCDTCRFICNTTFPAYTQTLARKMAAQHLGIRCERSPNRNRGTRGSRYRNHSTADDRFFREEFSWHSAHPTGRDGQLKEEDLPRQWSHHLSNIENSGRRRGATPQTSDNSSPTPDPAPD